MKKNKEGFEDLIKKYSDSPFAMQSLDAQGRFLFVNRAWSKTTGYGLKDVKGKLFSYIFDEEGKKLFKKNFTQFKKKKQAKNIVFNLVKKNGQIISAVFEGRFFCDKSGKLMFTECLLKDISKYIDDSKTSLAHKFQSENKFKKLYDSMEEGVAMHEIVYNKAGKATNYRILDVNLAFQKILGIKKEQVVGKIATKAYNVNRPPYFDVYLKTAQTGKPTKIEAYFEPFKKHFRILVVSIEKNKFTTIFEDVTDKHIAHKQIEEAKNKFKFLLHNSAQIILIINRAGKIQFANNTLFEQLGYRSEDVVGKLFTKFLTKSSALAGMKSLALEMSGKPQPALTIDVFAKDGSIRKLKTSENTKWYEENGKRVGLIISAVDITEEALAKEELAKNEKKYRALIENSQAIIFMIDREGKFILSEGGGLNVLGLKPGQVVGQSVYKIYKDYPKIINGVKEALRGKVVRGEIKVGQTFFDIMYTPFEGPKGGVLGISGMAVDITSIKQAELSLSESEERFRAIFNGSNEAMFIKNKDFKYVDINTEAEKYLQKMKSEVIGKTDRELFGRKAADYTLKADTRVLKGEVIKEEIVKTYNKKLEFYSLTKLPLKGKDGRPIGICGIARNISQERNKEQELKVKSKINKDILDNAPFGIYVVNQAGGIDYVNKAMIDISAANYTRFMELNMLKHKQYIQYGLAKKIKSVLEGKSFRINGLEYTSYFGKKTTVRNFVGIPLTEEGSPKALIIIEDITELKRKEERLAKSAAEWTSTFDAMSDGISLHSANYEILNVNKAICKLLGKKKEQLIGQKCFSVFHRKTEPIGACPLARVVKTGKKELVEYFEPTLKIWLSVQISPILNKKGKVKKLIHVTRDISSRKKFEEELKNRNEELKKFNNIAVDRELKMIDLKRHIRELESEINWDKKI